MLSVSFEVAGWVKDVGGWVNEHRRCEPLGGSGGMPPQKILKSRRSEMAFPAFSNTYFPLKWQCKLSNKTLLVSHLTESIFLLLVAAGPAIIRVTETCNTGGEYVLKNCFACQVTVQCR